MQNIDYQEEPADPRYFISQQEALALVMSVLRPGVAVELEKSKDSDRFLGCEFIYKTTDQHVTLVVQRCPGYVWRIYSKEEGPALTEYLRQTDAVITVEGDSISQEAIQLISACIPNAGQRVFRCYRTRWTGLFLLVERVNHILYDTSRPLQLRFNTDNVVYGINLQEPFAHAIRPCETRVDWPEVTAKAKRYLYTVGRPLTLLPTSPYAPEDTITAITDTFGLQRTVVARSYRYISKDQFKTIKKYEHHIKEIGHHGRIMHYLTI